MYSITVIWPLPYYIGLYRLLTKAHVCEQLIRYITNDNGSKMMQRNANVG